MSKSKEIRIVKSRTVWCDGGSATAGHPRVFLEIKHDKEDVTCPYCGQVFLYMQEDEENGSNVKKHVK